MNSYLDNAVSTTVADCHIDWFQLRKNNLRYNEGTAIFKGSCWWYLYEIRLIYYRAQPCTKVWFENENDSLFTFTMLLLLKSSLMRLWWSESLSRIRLKAADGISKISFFARLKMDNRPRPENQENYIQEMTSEQRGAYFFTTHFHLK